MADEYTATIRIRRPAKVRTDDRGHTVWVDTVETAQLELVSTGQLKQLLEAGDEDTRSTIRQMVQGQPEGVLARDPSTGLFQIISEDDLEAALNEQPETKSQQPADVTLEPVAASGGGEELSLVSTQLLRKVLRKDATPAQPGSARDSKPAARKDEGGGFDPYNTG